MIRPADRQSQTAGSWAWSLGALLAAAAGCSSKPVAPKLDQNERVYHNAEEGFRFEAPAGWGCLGFGRFPAGEHKQERVWVKYRNLKNLRPTFFRAGFIDLPETTTVMAYLAERPPGPENWRMVGVAEKAVLDGTPATRYRFHGSWDDDAMIKEVVAVRRGRRVLFFTGIYPVNDARSRDAIRATYQTIRWGIPGQPG